MNTELSCYYGIHPLETSLVEWKLLMMMQNKVSFSPLETSLVEWKRANTVPIQSPGDGLGNFLSGMETADSFEQRRDHPHPWKLP